MVDDHIDTSTAVQMILERQGYTVIVANTAADALKIAEQREFDIVISDIGLPDENGLTLLPKLRAIRQVPAIALSGFGTEDDKERSSQAGFDEHIIKPFNLASLRQSIERLLETTNGK
jgi:DNA-binding response OmpR family regulator